MFHADKVFLATAYPQSELVGTMKRLLACLALCASLSASAQDDNCTVLGIQDLTQMIFSLKAQIDSLEANALNRSSVRAIARSEAVAQREGLPLAPIDFADGDFYESSLNNLELAADFSNTQLTSVNFTESNLSNSNFSNATLEVCFFTFCNLENVDFSGANLGGSVFQFANLTGANLSTAVFGGAFFECIYGCPTSLPSGYICEPDLDNYCSPFEGLYHIVPE